jgi:hypothetical protein|tara:strand:+ start:2177 stop:2569 length:393 start_codon:yes stop_codon:yes gene_type:complete
MKDFILSDDLERCQPWIEDALQYSGGTHTFDDIVLGIAEMRMQLWAAPKGCIVTEIVVYPKKKVLHLFLAGGDLEQLIDMNNDITNWAVGQGCTGGTITGRLGWKKALAPLGWKLKSANYAFDLNNSESD